MRFRFWKNKKEDRRLAGRIAQPALTAFYWTGGAPRPYRVRDIGVCGAFIETEDHWDKGSLIHLVLECNGSSEAPTADGKSLGVWAEVARVDSGGMGVEFVLATQGQAAQLQKFLEKMPRRPEASGSDAKGRAAGE